MNNTRTIARKLFYTGECDMLPSEEEERELRTKYGMTFPYKNRFNQMVDDFTEEQEEPIPGDLSPDVDEEPVEKIFQNPFPPHARMFVAKLVDELDDDLNLDVNNVDPKKYKRIESRFPEIKKTIWRKIMLSRLSDPVKQDLARGVERSQSFRRMLAYLLLKTRKL